MTQVFENSTISKVYVAGQNECYPSPQGVSWTTEEKVLFFGGANYKEEFPTVYKSTAANGRRFQVTTSGRLKTQLQRSSVDLAAVGKYGKAYLFGGRHWKCPSQPANDSFTMGGFTGNSYSWDTVSQVGCSPSPRFGHSLTSCENFFFVYGGLCMSYTYTFSHVNTNIFRFSSLNVWTTKPTELPPLAYHSSTYIGDNTAVIVGGLQLRENRMVRPGHIAIITFFRNDIRVSSFESELFISGHCAVELGDYLFIFGGYLAQSVEGEAKPSHLISRIHIPSLREGKVSIQQQDAPVIFTPCYIAKTGLRTMSLFRITDRSVWTFVANRPPGNTLVEAEELEQVVNVLPPARLQPTTPIQPPTPIIDMGQEDQNDESDSDLEFVADDSPSESDSDEEDEPLFCIADSCTLNNLTVIEQQRLKWVQCKICVDWFHERCLNSDKVCSPCKP